MLKNIGSNWLVLVVAVMATYFLLPFTIAMLGREQYGTWLLITSMTGYLSLFLLGVPMASVRFICKDLASDNYDNVNATISNCAMLYIILGSVALTMGTALLVLFTRLYSIPTPLHRAAIVAFWLVIVYIAGGFFGQLPNAIFSAHSDFVLRNIVQVAMWSIRCLVTVIMVYRFPSLISLAVIQLIILITEAAINWTIIAKRYPRIQLRFGSVEWRSVRSILSFSGFVLILNLCNQLSFQTDSLVIGRFLHVSDIPFYAVANSICMYLIDFVIGIAAVVMPIATRLEAQGRLSELRIVLLKWSKIAFSIAVVAASYICLFGHKFIAAWMGPSFESSSGLVLRILMISNIVFLPARGVCMPILMGIGKPKRAVGAFAVTGVLNLLLSIVLVRSWGLAGVAWGTAVPNIVFSVALWLITCKELQMPRLEYVAYVVPRVLVGCAPAVIAGVWLLNSGPKGAWAAVLVSGAAMFLFSAVTWFLYVYHNDPYVAPGAYLSRRLHRRVSA